MTGTVGPHGFSTEPPPVPPPVPPSHTADGRPTNEERTIAAILHAITFVTAFIGPLVIWLVKKDESRFVDHHGKEVLNFHITVFGISLLSMALSFMTCGVGLVIAIPLLWLVSLAVIVLTIVGAVKAYDGALWRYPFTVRLLS